VNSQDKFSQNKDAEQVSVPLPALFAETAKSFYIRNKMNNFTLQSHRRIRIATPNQKQG